jgi:hypothetical protein
LTCTVHDPLSADHPITGVLLADSINKNKGNTLLFSVVDPDCLNPDVASDPEFVPDLY